MKKPVQYLIAQVPCRQARIELTGEMFNADYPLTTYINVAYKILLTREQYQTLVGHLPSYTWKLMSIAEEIESPA